MNDTLAADADATNADAECIRLASASSVVLLGGPEESIFSFDHVAGPHTTQEQFFRGDHASPVAHPSHPDNHICTSSIRIWLRHSQFSRQLRHSQFSRQLTSLALVEGLMPDRHLNSPFIGLLCSALCVTM